MPQVERTSPPYAQIAAHYRAVIAGQELRPGDQLPTVADIASEWGVSPGTAHKAMRALRAERLILTTQQGSVVSDRRATLTPVDRIRASHDSATNLRPYETVTAAGIVQPKAHERYVPALLGIDDDNALVIRRETITHDGDTPVALTVVWLPTRLAEVMPDLLSASPLTEPLTALVERATGQRVRYTSNWVEARLADQREADALKLSLGAAVLAGTYLYSDEHAPLEYGEYVVPTGQVLQFEIEV